jgi:O-antigen ligase
MPSYVNHAHNDWLEIWLEGGFLALAVLVAFLIWFVFASFGAWRAPLDRGRALDRALPQAASIVVILVLLHSAVDYPLRTTALMTLFAFCCALLVPPIRRPHADAPRDRSGEPRGWRRIGAFPALRPRPRAHAWRARRFR